MVVTAAILMAALGGSVLSVDAVADFPRGYFDTKVRQSFQRHVMASWPGPTELMRRWAVAARRLYASGAPWLELTVLRPDSEQNRERRDQLIKWFEPLLAPNGG